jgi:glyoxylase-like metal-dependent hydrolase (beta-lactamase superfamily II)
MLDRFIVAYVCSAACAAQNPWSDLGQALPGSAGAPLLEPHGPLANGSPTVLELRQARANAQAFLVGGLSSLALPLAGGVLVPAPDYIAPPTLTGTDGSAHFELDWPVVLGGGVPAYFQWWVLDPIATQGLAASNAMTSTSQPAIATSNFALPWINGTACASEPLIQIQQYDADTFVLRQSLCTNFEAPFMTLLFGTDKVLLQDTGNGGIPIASVVQTVIQDWLTAHGQSSIQLIVSHSHGHGDHVKGDPQFVGLPNTTLVGTGQAAVQAFFQLSNWPLGSSAYDLGGGRIVDVLPLPGHQAAHIALYDRRTSLVFTDDSLYAGRLYISDFPVYRASMQRLADFLADKPIAHVLGCHVEMSGTPGVDFPLGSLVHPHEHPLQLRRRHLLELVHALDGMASAPFKDVHAEFIVFPLN